MSVPLPLCACSGCAVAGRCGAHVWSPGERCVCGALVPNTHSQTAALLHTLYPITTAAMRAWRVAPSTGASAPTLGRLRSPAPASHALACRPSRVRCRARLQAIGGPGRFRGARRSSRPSLRAGAVHHGPRSSEDVRSASQPEEDRDSLPNRPRPNGPVRRGPLKRSQGCQTDTSLGARPAHRLASALHASKPRVASGSGSTKAIRSTAVAQACRSDVLLPSAGTSSSCSTPPSWHPCPPRTTSLATKWRVACHRCLGQAVNARAGQAVSPSWQDCSAARQTPAASLCSGLGGP